MGKRLWLKVTAGDVGFNDGDGGGDGGVDDGDSGGGINDGPNAGNGGISDGPDAGDVGINEVPDAGINEGLFPAHLLPVHPVGGGASLGQHGVSLRESPLT